MSRIQPIDQARASVRGARAAEPDAAPAAAGMRDAMHPVLPASPCRLAPRPPDHSAAAIAASIAILASSSQLSEHRRTQPLSLGTPHPRPAAVRNSCICPVCDGRARGSSNEPLGNAVRRVRCWRLTTRPAAPAIALALPLHWLGRIATTPEAAALTLHRPPDPGSPRKRTGRDPGRSQQAQKASGSHLRCNRIHHLPLQRFQPLLLDELVAGCTFHDDGEPVCRRHYRCPKVVQ